MELELLGPPTKAELAPILEKIKSDGHNYIDGVTIPAEFPFHTIITKDMKRKLDG